MATQSETGHAKNLANLLKLIDLTTQMGQLYSPSNPKLSIVNLTGTQAQCTADQGSYLAKDLIYKTETNNREIAFRPVVKLCTQILDHVSSLDIPQQTIDDTAAIVHKINGYFWIFIWVCNYIWIFLGNYLGNEYF